MRKGTKKLAIALSLAMMLPSVAMPGTIPARAATIEDVQLVSAVSLPANYDGKVVVNKDNFPNAEFKKYIMDTYHVVDGGTLDTTTIDSMILDGSKIQTDIKGIEYFTSLKTLSCSGLGLTSLDVTTLDKLEYLNCSANSLTTLDLSKNPNLVSLYCGQNSKDFKALDLSKNVNLEILSCLGDSIDKLSLVNNKKLKYINCAATSISELDVSGCKDLEVLNCAKTGISTLDLSNNLNLKVFIGYRTMMSELDLKNHTKLTDLYIGYKKIKSESTYLTKLQNDANAEAAKNQTEPPIIVGDEFSEDGAGTLYRYGDLTDYFQDEYSNLEASTYTSVDVSGCTSLKKIFCDKNAIKKLVLTGASAVTELHCNENALTDLDVSGLANLTGLYVNNNRLGLGSGLDISNNTMLEHIFCANNELEEINVDSNSNLKVLICNENRIINDVESTKLDISKIAGNLIELNCNKNMLQILDLSEATAGQKYVLGYLKCDNNMLTSLDITDTNINEARYVSCKNNTYNIVLDTKYEFETTSLPGKPKGISNGIIGIKTFNEGAFFYNGAAQLVPQLGVNHAKYTYVIGQVDVDGKPVDVTADFTLKFDPFDMVVLFEGEKTELEKTTSFFINDRAKCTAVRKDNTAVEMPLITWKSTDENVVEIGETTGELLAKDAGKAQIRVWMNGRERGYVNVEVKKKVDSISLMCDDEVINGKTFNIKAGSRVSTEEKTMTVKTAVEPADATDKSVTFSSSKPIVNFKYINDKGYNYGATITGTDAGNTTITVTSNDTGEVVASFELQIERLPDELRQIKTPQGKTSVGQNQNLELTPVFAPATTTNQKVVWESSDTGIAKVDDYGKVTGVSPGSVIIKCTSVADPELSKTIELTVTPKAESIDLKTNESNSILNDSEYILELGVGGNPRVQLVATVNPVDVYSSKVVWKSSNDKVAMVGANGLVTAIAAGDAVITVASETDDNVIAKLNIKVKQRANGIRLSNNSVRLCPGKTETVVATVVPENASNKKVVWTSEDETIATVSSTGVVSAKKPGATRLVCKTVDGSERVAYCSVTVLQPVTRIKLKSSNGSSIPKGKSISLIATVSPENAAIKTVTWTSSNPKVATVSNGVVTGVRKGTAVITCTAADGSGVKATYKVSVVNPVTKITLKKTSLKLKKGRSYTLKYTVGPKSATNKKVKWTTSNKKIATVSTKGKVTAKRKKGTAVITCKAADGSGVYATCTVTVR